MFCIAIEDADDDDSEDPEDGYFEIILLAMGEIYTCTGGTLYLHSCYLTEDEADRVCGEIDYLIETSAEDLRLDPAAMSHLIIVWSHGPGEDGKYARRISRGGLRFKALPGEDFIILKVTESEAEAQEAWQTANTKIKEFYAQARATEAAKT